MKSIFNTLARYCTGQEALSVEFGIELIDIFIRDYSLILQINFVSYNYQWAWCILFNICKPLSEILI